MGDEHMMNGVIVFPKIIIGGLNGATGQAKHDVYPFVHQAFPNDLSTSFHLAHILYLHGFAKEIYGRFSLFQNSFSPAVAVPHPLNKKSAENEFPVLCALFALVAAWVSSQRWLPCGQPAAEC